MTAAGLAGVVRAGTLGHVRPVVVLAAVGFAAAVIGLAVLGRSAGGPRTARTSRMGGGLGGSPRTGRLTGPAGLGRRSGFRPASRTPPPGRNRARWARRADLRSLAVRKAGDGRLVIGRSGRTLVATEARHSILVVGPTQSGKTTGLAIPAILEWEGAVVATSVKDDLGTSTRAWRAGRGETWVFDPTASSGLRAAATWSPLAEATTWSGAQRMASWLVEATPAKGGLSDGAFWYAAAAKLLAPLLLAAGCSGRTMGDVVRWTDLDDCDEPARLLYENGEDAAGVALAACAARDGRVRSSVTTTLETVLGPFEDPVVAEATNRSEIDPHRLLLGENTLYLCGPSHEQARVQGLFAALVSTVVAAAVEHANRNGQPLNPPLLLVLDEAANIAPLRDLDTLASTGAGLGIQLLTVCQDLAQLAHRYGPERSRTIANNHRGKLILSGVSDLTTLDLISGLAGEAAMPEETVSTDLRDGRQTRTFSTAFRRLVTPDELRRITPGDGVLVYGHLPAARVRLRPWYLDRSLRARSLRSCSLRDRSLRAHLGPVEGDRRPPARPANG